MAKVIIWARFSPQPNAKENETVEHQIADGHAWIARYGHSIASVPGTTGAPGEFFVKEYSGANEDNAELQRAVDALGRGYILWARDWSRFYRNDHAMNGLAIDVAKHRASIWSEREGKYESADPWRKFTTKLAWLMAELRLDEIRANTSKGLRRRQARGDLVSRHPVYGRSIDPTDPKKTIVHATEQETIARMLELHDKGLSWRKIAAALVAEGRTPRSAATWEPTTLAKIVRRELERRESVG